MNEILIPVSDFLDFAEIISDALAENCVPDDVADRLSVVITPDAGSDGKMSVTIPMYGKEAGGKRVR